MRVHEPRVSDLRATATIVGTARTPRAAASNIQTANFKRPSMPTTDQWSDPSPAISFDYALSLCMHIARRATIAARPIRRLIFAPVKAGENRMQTTVAEARDHELRRFRCCRAARRCRMSNRNREHRNSALDVLRAEGATITNVRQNKHTVIKFETPAGAGSVAISTTPSDGRAALNTATDIRRKLAALADRAAVVPNNIPDSGHSRQDEAPRVRQAPQPARSNEIGAPPSGLLTSGHGRPARRRSNAVSSHSGIPSTPQQWRDQSSIR